MTVQELGFQNTPLGELTLRRRLETRLGNCEVFEVKLGDEYLMSSLFTEAEQQLASLGLAPLEGDLDVVIGGLGKMFGSASAHNVEFPNPYTSVTSVNSVYVARKER